MGKLTCLLKVAIAVIILTLSVNTFAQGEYICGDVDNDEAVNLLDILYIIDFVYDDGPDPIPIEAGNVNADNAINLLDILDLIANIYDDGSDLDCGPLSDILTYPIVDTDQEQCFDNNQEISPPSPGETFYGQDAQYMGTQMSYTNNGDSTITDNATGLMWTKSPDLDGDGDIDYDDKLTHDEAMSYPDVLNAASFAGYNDWRLPSIKEIYSLMNFNGTDPSGPSSPASEPYIDTAYFDFAFGDESAGERIIDAQFWTTSVYTGNVFETRTAVFGLNLADGRIKGYPSDGPSYKYNYVYFVRGNTSYGINDFVDNEDGTITDNATGLTWTQDDVGGGTGTGPRSGMIWSDALAYVETKNDENYLGHNDWRLPNAKELQSIVDYSRGPDATSSAAIDAVFNVTQITNEMGQADYPWYWTGTTHISANGFGSAAVYLCFGRGTGYMMDSWMDVHGAGCQRSDGKDGDFSGYTYISDGYYLGVAPQGDGVRMYNYVRLVRDAD